MKIKFIGTIINQLRNEQDISIEELSRRSGVPVERISIIEQGEVIPSLSTMIKISHALGARLGTLIDNEEETTYVVTRANEANSNVQPLFGGEPGKSRQLDFLSLASGMKERAMEPMIVELEAGKGKVEINDLHDGEEFIYVLEGEIEVTYGHTTEILTKGDSIYYKSSTPHSISSASNEPARVLAVIYTPY